MIIKRSAHYGDNEGFRIEIVTNDSVTHSIMADYHEVIEGVLDDCLEQLTRFCGQELIKRRSTNYRTSE
jgi:hypothetical protein